jgi:hypothetical protein
VSSTFGWIVWAALAVYTATLWLAAFRDSNGGVRFLAATCASTFTVALAISALPDFPKLHLLWAAVVIYFGSMTIAGKVIDIRLKTAPSRAEKESAKTGEPKEEILKRELETLGYGEENQPS